MNKLISIIIPVKNGSNYLAEAIEGIKKQNMNVEIIVVDDASTDNTVEIAKSLGCVVLHHETCKGQVAGKNTGLKQAKGEYVMFHDHDDIMNEGTLKRFYDELENNLQIAAIMGKIQDFISPDCSNVNVKIQENPYWGLFSGAVLMRKNIYDKIGLFEENITTGEILVLQNKMKENNLETKRIDFVSTMRRIHNTNYGQTHREREFKDYASVLRARLKRK